MAAPQTTLRPKHPVRYLYASLGLTCVALGAVGVFLPGLPTTIFVILASYFLARSCPWLEERLVRSRFFGPYLKYIDGDVPMPRKAKITAISMMWTMIAISSTVLILNELSMWIVAAVIAAGLFGTVVIVKFRGLKRPAGAPATPDRAT